MLSVNGICPFYSFVAFISFFKKLWWEYSGVGGNGRSWRECSGVGGNYELEGIMWSMEGIKLGYGGNERVKCPESIHLLGGQWPRAENTRVEKA